MANAARFDIYLIKWALYLLIIAPFYIEVGISSAIISAKFSVAIYHEMSANLTYSLQ